MANTIDVEQVLSQMRLLAAQARKPVPMEESAGASGATDFSKLLADSIDQVNQAQREARGLKTAFELGERGVELPEVMVSIQKASISFAAMTEVRNKLLSAYQDVMNMPI